MKISTAALILFGLMNTGLVCLAQNKEIEITQMSMSDFTNKSVIMDMAQDKHGNLWMLHSVDGLTRYDGENMRLFSPNLQDSNSISGGRLEKLHIDKNGIIWIGTFNSGIDRLDPVTEKFTHYRHNPNDPKSLRSDVVRAFVVKQQKAHWTNISRLHRCSSIKNPIFC